MTSTELAEQIESEVRARNTRRAEPLIRKYLRLNQKSVSSRVQSADWYRRLGQLRKGLSHVFPKKWGALRTGPDSEETRLFLWTARFLNLLGATPYAIDILQQLQPRSAEDLTVAGNIFLTGIQYSKARACFEKALKLDSSSYRSRLNQISLADCIAGEKKLNESLKLLRSIRVQSDESLLKGIRHQVMGEHLSLLGRYELAKKEFLKALPYFPEDDLSDRAFLFKHLAYVEGRLGDTDSSQRHFKEALQIFSRFPFRPEMKLDLYRLQNQLNCLDRKIEPLLRFYPGLAPSFLNLPGIPDTSTLLIRPSAKLFIQISRGEYRWKEKLHLGIPKEVELVSLLIRAGEEGVPIARLQCLLWKEEVSSFLQLDQRLHKLLRRVRRAYGLHVFVKDGVVHLDEKHEKEVGIESAEAPLPLSIQEKLPRFTQQQFARYYRLGKTQSFSWLNTFVKTKQMVKIREGKQVYYSAS